MERRVESYLQFEHRGVQCLLPASNVESVEERLGERTEQVLWDGEDVGGERFLRTVGGAALLRISSVRSLAAEDVEMLPLPPMVQAQVPRCVVGVATVHQTTMWVLQLEAK